jgi:glycosyltransferase involved in cell wall biosynthesis
MIILHIITRLIVGGAQENTLLTCEGLHARGHEVVLLTGPSRGPEGSLMSRAAAGGYALEVTGHLVRAPHPFHDAAAYRHIRKLCRKLKPDVVHTHSSKAGIVGRAAAAAERRPLVVHTIHGLPFHPYQSAWVNKSWIALERWAAKKTDAIISVADAMTRQAVAAGVGRPEQFTTIYSAMDVQPFIQAEPTPASVRQRLGIAPDRLVFGTIARLQPLKGHDDLLAIAGDIFARIPNAHFLWLGDGVFRSRFEAILKQKGWSDRFTLTGLVPPAQIPQLIRAMDVLVHPSYREGLARALPQAALSGLPLISYDCDGASEVCIPDRTGILVKTGDCAALREAIFWMAEQAEQRGTLGQAGRLICLERFPASVMVDRIEELYLRIARK